MSKALEESRRYERAQEQCIPEEERACFHLTPRTGWLNDPNGFSHYDGCWHLFYQYHPYDSFWGPMHWGHAVSDDLVRWRYMPAAMAPDEDYDRDGCFSGSAGVLPDGRHLLMYTGIVWDDSDPKRRGKQTQNIAVGDGREYAKYAGNPVLTEADLPEGADIHEFRDPNLHQMEDGTWKVYIPCRIRETGTALLEFGSPDGFRWTPLRTYLMNEDEFGTMWECPDVFTLDGRPVVLVSAMDMLADGTEFYGGNNALCLIGKPIGKPEEAETCFTRDTVQMIDYGMDFYAAQTAEAPDGRRILIAWMQNPDTANQRSREHPIYGQMTIARELSIRDGRLMQQPVRELLRYRTDPVSVEGLALTDECIEVDGIRGRVLDLEIRIRPDKAGYRSFTIHFGENDHFHSAIRFRPEEGLLRIDRRYSGSRRAMLAERETTVPHRNGTLRMRLILDRYSAELFIGEGEKVLSFTYDTELDAEGISFRAEGSVLLDVTKYRLTPAGME